MSQSAPINGQSDPVEPLPSQPETELIRRQDEVIAELDELDSRLMGVIETLAAERKAELEAATADVPEPQKSELSIHDQKETGSNDKVAKPPGNPVRRAA